MTATITGAGGTGAGGTGAGLTSAAGTGAGGTDAGLTGAGRAEAARAWSGISPLGRLSIEPLDLDEHLGRLHAWVTHPRSRFWQMQDASVPEVRDAYAAIAADPHQQAWLGRRDGEPLFLVETYDPAHGELRHHYPVRDGDVGMHLLVAPPASPEHGLTSAVMAAVMAFLFADPRCERVVVEPDVRNERIAVRNAEVGFAVAARIRLPEKAAWLSFCTREQHLATRRVRWDHPVHLAPEPMAVAQRHLVAKAIAEFAHERLVGPLQDDDGGTVPPGAGTVPRDGGTVRRDGGTVPRDGDPYLLHTAPGVTYRFRARRQPLNHWSIDAASLIRTVDGAEVPPDAQQLVLELREALGLPEHLLGVYLEEVAATLAGSAWKLAHPAGRSVDELLAAGFQQIEAAMTEGHPAFVAGNGRIGFGLGDHERYAPEAGRPVRLVWLAARREHSHLALGRGVDERQLYEGQLGEETLRRFADRLRHLGLDPRDYRYLPVHPWQWEHKLAVTFAPDVAARRLVHLGEGPDRHQAQQSLRTFFNLDRPSAHYLKTALSVQNMGFLRGLSPAYMRATPAINDWVGDLLAPDPELRRSGFAILPELAAVGYTGDAYHRGPAGPHQRMVAALWRQSPVPHLAPGERASTMAALLHRDPAGRHLATALVTASGVGVRDWVRRYLEAYLRPLVHCLLAHDLAFMPHGENVILVLRDQVPVRALVKDIGEEVALMHGRPLPAQVERARLRTTDEIRALALFTDVFDGFLRYLAAILDADGLLPVDRFWQLVRACVAGHREEHPDLHRRLDLFTPRFAHSCLNRLQLRNTLQMVDLADQPSSLLFAGTLDNPIAPPR